MRILFIVFVCYWSSSLVYCQQKFEELSYEVVSDDPEWVRKMYSTNPNPGEVIDLFDAYYKTHPFVKDRNTQYFKRWIRHILREDNRTEEEDLSYLRLRKRNAQSTRSAAWTCIGPYDWDHNASGRSYAPGSAHVYTVEQSISNPDILYAGTATTGMWKSIDHGMTWFPLTEDQLISTVYAIEIDPTNPDIVYASMFNSIYKSTNGGLTFQPTGNSTFQQIEINVRDMRISPSNSSLIFACAYDANNTGTEEGLYRSADGGATWSQVLVGDFQEIEFHPTNNAIIYTVKNEGNSTHFYRSIDNGVTFIQMTNGWPVPPAGGEQKRTEIAVTPAQPDYVYAHCSGEANGGSGLYGVYVSQDQGQTWTFNCCGPQPAGPPSTTNMNLMGWSDDGTDNGGQYYYDMGFDISPTNANRVFLAGVNLWVSSDGGNSFVCPAKWSHPHKPNYVHADVHDIHYYAHTNEIWVACDGGIFYSNDDGANFHRRVVGIEGTDFWGFGQGWWHGDIMLGGAYHNGTLLKEDQVYINDWLCTDGGDGTLGFVNPGLDKQVYSWFNIKTLQSDRNIAPVTRDFSFKPNNSYIVGKSNDLLFDPRYYTHWLTGSGTKLYKTVDNGYTYTELYDFGEDVASATQCWSDPNVIYVCTFPDWWGLKKIFRSIDGGQTWTDITPSSAQVNGNTWIPYDIEVDHDDPMKVWIARTSMYDSSINGFAIFYSDNGGQSWQNISGTGLNGQSPTSLYLQKGSAHGIYIGTRRGVFYKDDNHNDWVLYSDGLPAKTHSTKMAGYYRKQKLRNATNRSVWESPFHTPSQPVAMPSANGQVFYCTRDTVRFVDHSVVSDNNVQWQWSFPGGTPATSTMRNPSVVYDMPGTYDVTLTITDMYGTDTKTILNMITIENRCTLDTVPGKVLVASGSSGHGIVPDFNLDNVNVLTVTAWVKPSGIQPDYSAIFMSDGVEAAGMNFKNGNNSLAYHWPGGSWSWNSGLIVPPDVWSFVAMVVTPTGITLYCNESSATHNVTLSQTTITSFRLGSYRNWASRNMTGHIDEVALYDRALSRDEIRLLRHLTKHPEEDASLIAYYQFNDDLPLYDFDKAGNHNILLTNTASKIVGYAPVGGGVSQKFNVTGGGLYTFSDPGVDIFFPNSGVYPQGEIVVNRINHLPINVPTEVVHLPNSYFIINNYGTNSMFSPLDSIRFYDTGNLAATCNLDNYVLFLRNRNDGEGSWGDVIDMADYVYPNPYDNPYITYNSSTQDLNTFGQFVHGRMDRFANPSNGIELCNGFDDNCNGLIDDNYSTVVINGENDGNGTLRALIPCIQPADVITFDPSITSVLLSTPLLIDKPVHIQGNNTMHLSINLNDTGFGTAGEAILISSTGLLGLDSLLIVHQNNTVTKPIITNQGTLHLTSTTIDGTPSTIIYQTNGAQSTVGNTVIVK